MTSALDRRGEAHLWLALEDALAGARQGSGDPGPVWEARRRFSTIADALVAVSAIAKRDAESLVVELYDALAVRGLVAPGGFQGRPHATFAPIGVADGPRRLPTQPGEGWLEAEIEHHLDLVVDLRPESHPEVGNQVLVNLVPPARALQAVGSLRTLRRLDDLVTTLRAAGYHLDHGDVLSGEGDVDRGWLSFLRAKPIALRTDMATGHERVVAIDIGRVDETTLTVSRVAWSADVLEIELHAPEAPSASSHTWRASAFDDAGQLHLGQPGQRLGGDDSRLVFRLRPGLRPEARSFALRITHDAARFDERVSL